MRGKARGEAQGTVQVKFITIGRSFIKLGSLREDQSKCGYIPYFIFFTENEF